MESYFPPKASTLNPKVKRYFNPDNIEDLVEYHYFINNGTWKDVCPFMIEWPRVSIPDMISERILQRHMATILDTLRNDKLIEEKI